MSIRRLFPLLTTIALLLAGCAGATPTATSVPTATNVPTVAPTATVVPAGPATAQVLAPLDTLPYPHTACAAGVNLIGQTINLYHLFDPGDQVPNLTDPVEAGYADASAYLNAHGGICGATIGQVLPDPNQPYDVQAAYAHVAGLTPKPVLIVLYNSGDGEALRLQLAKDQIAALGFRMGSPLALYGDDGKTPGWIFSTNPLYMDQIGSMCNYVAAHPERYPHPSMGFIAFDDAVTSLITPAAGRDYCAAKGVGYAGAVTVTGDDFYSVQPMVDKLLKAGATIIYTNAHLGVPESIGEELVKLGVQTTVTVAAFNWAFDPAVAVLSQVVDPKSVPPTNGMIGSHTLRSLAELDNPGIQLITRQADANQRAPFLRTDAYVKAWSTTDLFREVYVQTGNRVGYDHVTGADIKTTLEKIVYAPLAGVERIDYQGGARRALAVNRIGQMGFWGQDGKTAAGPGNPPMIITNLYVKFFSAFIQPLTDYQPAPDLRPGGADVPAASATAGPPATPTKQP